MLHRLVWGCVAMLASVAAAQGPASPPAKPNIVFILADDQRWDSLGVAGNTKSHTPSLDRLASEGMYFSQATCHAPQCAPERAVLITGLTPTQSGYLSIDVQTDGADAEDAFESLPTLPSLLRDAGYRTVLVGKWHLKPRPWRSGFTDVRLWFDGGQTPYENPSLRRGIADAVATEGNITELFADDAEAFIRSPEAKARPFYLWLCFNAPHEPCGPTPERIHALYDSMSDEDLMPLDMPRPAGGRFKGVWADYYRAVAHLDEQVGLVLEAIDDSGLRDNTIVVYTSDSGIMMGRRGIDSKVCPYEDSVRVPAIVRAPMLGGGPGRSDAPVSNLDLPVTIALLGGVIPPVRWMGRDLTALWRTGSDPALASSVLLWAEGTREPWKKFSNRTIRTPRWKLIVWEDPERADNLYDIAADPGELRELASSSEAADAMATLNRELKAWLEKAKDPAAEWNGKWGP